MSAEVVGFGAGILVAVSLVPQLVKILRTKSTKDISLLWNLILMSGLILWVVYGFMTDDEPIKIFASIEVFLTLSLLFLKIKYK